MVGRYEENKGSDNPYFKILIYPTEKATTNWHSDGRDNCLFILPRAQDYNKKITSGPKKSIDRVAKKVMKQDLDAGLCCNIITF